MPIPSDIAGLVLWLEADAIVGLADDDPVATWEDSSAAGNDATQATSSKRPTYKTGILNSLPVVRFDGSDDCLESVLTASDATITAFAVIKPGTAGYRTILGASLAGGMQWRIDQTSHLQIVNRQGEAFVGDSDTAVPTAGFSILTVQLGTDLNFWLDSVADGGQTSISPNLTAGRTTVVGANASSSEFFVGDIAEIVRYDSTLSSTDRGDIETYLIDKWFTAPDAPVLRSAVRSPLRLT